MNGSPGDPPGYRRASISNIIRIVPFITRLVGDPFGKEAEWEHNIQEIHNMSLNISTNTAALRAGSYLAKNNALLQRSLDRLASGKKLTSPIHDPGGLAVSMKLSSSINRLAGAQNNVQNAISFLEVQDGMLDSVGKIIDRMSELKGLASQDPMKSAQDRASYNNEFKDLQVQLYDISTHGVQWRECICKLCKYGHDRCVWYRD